MTYTKAIVLVSPWLVAGAIAIFAGPSAGAATAFFAFLQNWVFWESFR